MPDPRPEMFTRAELAGYAARLARKIGGSSEQVLHVYSAVNRDGKTPEAAILEFVLGGSDG